MSADFIRDNSISWIKASYFEEDNHPNYQIFYAFDTLGRIDHSNTSDDILTSYRYPDSVSCIKTTLNPEIGNKIIEISRGWQTLLVVIHSASGDSIYHRMVYDTLDFEDQKFIRCLDVVYPRRDTTYRQIYSIDGELLRYDIFNDRGEITAKYFYTYVDGKLDYTEYYEGEEFVYKEKITYYEDSGMRKQRVSVAGDDMFSNEETRNVTRYLLNDDGMLHQEVEFLGTEHVSTIGYEYQLTDPDKDKKKP